MLTERLVTADELAERLTLPRSWIYARAESGAMPSFKLGKYRRFELGAVLRWLEAQRSVAK